MAALAGAPEDDKPQVDSSADLLPPGEVEPIDRLDKERFASRSNNEQAVPPKGANEHRSQTSVSGPELAPSTSPAVLNNCGVGACANKDL
jgi:hypothetical protein